MKVKQLPRDRPVASSTSLLPSSSIVIDQQEVRPMNASTALGAPLQLTIRD